MRKLLVVLMTLLATACTDAGRSSTTIEGEQLLAEPPGGWKQVFRSDNPGIRLVEYIPEDQSNDAWLNKISFESLSGDPLPDPLDFVNGISTDQQGTCEGFESYSTAAGLENGYPTAVQLLICNRSHVVDQSQVTMIKSIQGNDYFYVITRAQRDAPLAEGSQALTEEEIAGWSLYMRAITVCDSRDPEHPCP